MIFLDSDRLLRLSDVALASRWIEEAALTDKERNPPLTPVEIARRDELDRQAMSAVSTLGSQDPARLWRLVMLVVGSTDHPWALCLLGCGPIEDVWLDRDTGQVRDGLTEEWRTNRNMRAAVQHVWTGADERAHFPEAVAILEDLQRKHAETVAREAAG